VVEVTMDGQSWLRKQLEQASPDLLRAMVQDFAEALMGAEADALCGAPYGERSPERVNIRNGYRERGWDTRTGTIELAIPKLRQGSYFPDWLLQPRRRAEQAFVSVIADAYLAGVSTRRVEKLVQQLGVERMSKSQVSRLAKSLDAIVEDMGAGGETDLPSSVLTKPQDPNAPQKPTKTAVPGSAKAPASIILLTDGQNNQFPPPLAILDQAISRGVRVYTVGVGTPAGAVLSLEGRSIRTALDETTLKQIAEDTDAQYFLATNEADLRKIYENLTTELVVRNEKTELTAYATLAAAVLAVFAGAFSLLWFNRLP